VMEMRAAKEIKGTVATPPSSDLFILSMAMALVTGCKTRVSPFSATPRTLGWIEAFKPGAVFTVGQDSCLIEPGNDGSQVTLRLSYADIPYRDFIMFLLLGHCRALAVDPLPPKRLERWAHLASKAGCALRDERMDGTQTLVLDNKDQFKIPDVAVDIDELHPFLGMAFGLRRPVDFVIDQVFSSPVRQAFAAFGIECAVKNNSHNKNEDPLLRRLRFMKTGKKSEGPLQFSVAADFSGPFLPEAEITLPGDDVYASLMILAKCLVAKGSLVIENAGLESWNTQILQALKTMGGSPGTQETRACSFGSVGTVIVQKMNLFGRKVECRPYWHYASVLPCMAVMAAFAQGQTVFRNLEELREDEPDGIGRIITCISALGARYGEMPDGLVIEGSKQFDGFDLVDAQPAPLAAAFAVAALKCRGLASVADDYIVKRWPDFKETLFSLCEFKE
jgi:EPSP synthase (3-phosphoshikimate 1-carboxyvinyltransferase)